MTIDDAVQHYLNSVTECGPWITSGIKALDKYGGRCSCGLTVIVCVPVWLVCYGVSLMAVVPFAALGHCYRYKVIIEQRRQAAYDAMHDPTKVDQGQ